MAGIGGWWGMAGIRALRRAIICTCMARRLRAQVVELCVMRVALGLLAGLPWELIQGLLEGHVSKFRGRARQTLCPNCVHKHGGLQVGQIPMEDTAPSRSSPIMKPLIMERTRRRIGLRAGVRAGGGGGEALPYARGS